MTRDIFSSHIGDRPGGERPFRGRAPTRLRFSDGVQLRTDGPYRMTRRHDGWYVVGHGMSMPCTDRADAEEILADLRREEGEE